MENKSRYLPWEVSDRRVDKCDSNNYYHVFIVI
jgi:hypothetical protein